MVRSKKLGLEIVRARACWMIAASFYNFVHSKSILHETFPFEDNAMTQVRPTVVKWRKSRA